MHGTRSRWIQGTVLGLMILFAGLAPQTRAEADYGDTSQPVNPRAPGSEPAAVVAAVQTLQHQIETVMEEAQVPAEQYRTLSDLAARVPVTLSEAETALSRQSMGWADSQTAIEGLAQKDALLNAIAVSATKIHGQIETLNAGLANARAVAERCASLSDAEAAREAYNAAVVLQSSISVEVATANQQMAQLDAIDNAVFLANGQVRMALSSAGVVAATVEEASAAALSLDSRIMNIRGLEANQDRYVQSLRADIQALATQYPDSRAYIEAELSGLPAGLSYSRNASRPNSALFEVYQKRAQAASERAAAILQESEARAQAAREVQSQLAASTEEEVMGMETIQNANAATAAAMQRAGDLPGLINNCALSHAGETDGNVPPAAAPDSREADAAAAQHQAQVQAEQQAIQQTRSQANFQQMQQNIQQMQQQQNQNRQNWQQQQLWQQQQQELIRQQQELQQRQEEQRQEKPQRRPDGVISYGPGSVTGGI